MKKIVIPLLIIAVLLVLALVGFCVYGIFNFFSELGESDEGYDEAVAYMQNVPKSDKIIYEMWDNLYLPSGEIVESDDSIYVQLVDESYVYYKLYYDEKECMYRASHRFENEELLLEVDSSHELEMIDSNTIMYYKLDSHTYYAYYLDTQRFVEFEKNDGYDFIYNMLKYESSPYTVEHDYRNADTKITVVERKTGKTLTLDEEHFRGVAKSTHIQAVEELTGQKLEFSRILRHNDKLYLDFTLEEPGYGYRGIIFTFELDFDSGEYTLVSWCESEDYDNSYTYIY